MESRIYFFSGKIKTNEYIIEPDELYICFQLKNTVFVIVKCFYTIPSTLSFPQIKDSPLSLSGGSLYNKDP